MELSNRRRSRTIKMYFNMMCVVFILIAVVLVWLGKDLAALFVGLGFAAFVVLALSLNLSYVSFSTENNKVTIRYYPVIAIFGREYNSIEFQQNTLLKFVLKETFLFSELSLIVKTKRGAADYPEISLGALNKQEISAIRNELLRIKESNSLGSIISN